MNNYIGDNIGETPYESPEDVDRSNGTLVMATNAELEPYGPLVVTAARAI